MIKLTSIYENFKSKKYYIFCDMDGVLVDFDKGYYELTGVKTHHADAQGSEMFWELFRYSLKNKKISEYTYWAGLDWQPGGKELWNYIKKYNPYILTAPSRNPESRAGKKTWVERLPEMKNIYFRYAKYKADLAGPGKILIDDRKDTIDSWNAKGGIGIHHTSASSTIKKLQELGL